jgi:hypothetical protein
VSITVVHDEYGPADGYVARATRLKNPSDRARDTTAASPLRNRLPWQTAATEAVVVKVATDVAYFDRVIGLYRETNPAR